MAQIFNNQKSFTDTVERDAFGRIRSSEITSLLELKHTYTAQDDLESTIVNGLGASYTHSNSAVIMEVTASDEYVIRQSLCCAPYHPGKSQIFEASFENFTPSLNITKRVGAFTSDPGANYDSSFDGFFLETTGLGHTFNIYQNGTPILTVNQTQWYSNDYLYNDIDWSRPQLMMVDYQWLGVGRVRFYMVIDGKPRLFYEYTHANNGSGVYLTYPNKPIRYEIRCTGPIFNPVQFIQICSQISTEGSIEDVYKIANIPNYVTSLPGDREAAILGFRLSQDNFRGYGPIARMKNFSILETLGADYIIYIIRKPELRTPPNWRPLDSHPSIEYAQAEVAVALGGNEIITHTFVGQAGVLFNSGPLELQNSLYDAGYDLDGNSIDFWIVVRPIGANGEFLVTMNIEYYD